MKKFILSVAAAVAVLAVSASVCEAHGPGFRRAAFVSPRVAFVQPRAAFIAPPVAFVAPQAFYAAPPIAFVAPGHAAFVVPRQQIRFGPLGNVRSVRGF